MAVVTIIITVSKIVDAILDPVMGSLIDMTRTRWGKLRPYILFSAAPVALLSALLFTVPDIAEPLKLVYFGVCYVLWSLAYTVCDVPLLGPHRFRLRRPDRARRGSSGWSGPSEPSRSASRRSGMPWLARLLSFGPETTSGGWSLAVFVTSFLGMGVFLLAFFFTRERQTSAASTGLTHASALRRRCSGTRPC